MNESNLHHPTAAVRKSLAARFELPYSDSMQDWEWEVADVARFDEFVAALRSGGLTMSERFSLMEVVVQCVEDMADREREGAWVTVEPLLRAGADLHRPTIEYWACFDAPDLDSTFHVSGHMRRLWRTVFLAASPHGA